MTTRKSITRLLFSSFLLVTAFCSAQQPKLQAPAKIENGRYGKLPLLFEKNQGQTDPSVRFFSNGSGYTVFLTSGEMVLSLRPSEIVNPGAFKPPSTNSAVKTAPAVQTKPVAPNSQVKPANTTLTFKLVGAKTNPDVVGENLQPTKVNYFIGNDRTKWQTNVATYGQVRYKNVYPGIDLVYYGNNRQVEYDFDVAPGADASKIQFDIKGADNLSVDTDGNLVLKKGTGELHFQAPVVYQQSNGRRDKVAGNYAVGAGNRVGFALASHDPSKPLVIDPVLSYSTFLGGRSDESANGITVDSAGNALVIGQTSSPDFPLAVLGGLDPNQNRIFLSKLDVSGTTMLWIDYICGTSGSDFGQSVAVDATGNVYIAGQANSSDFPLVNAYQSSLLGGSDNFLSKISSDGASLIYSTYLGGTSWDYATSVGVDSAGEAVIAGYTTSTDYPVANAFQPTVSPNQYNFYGDYGFVSKFSADGSSLVFSTYIAGSQTANCYIYCYPISEIYGIALDPSGNLYVAGRTMTTDFPTSQGAYLTSNPSANTYYPDTSFVASFTPSGTLNYSSYFGGMNYTEVYGLDVDASGAVYLTGNAPADGSFPITSTAICDPSVSSCDSAFVAKMTPDGSDLTYSTFLGPNNSTDGRKVKVDANGNAYILSNFSNPSFNLTNPIQTYTITSGVLIDEIDPTASSEVFSTYLGGDNGTNYADMALDSSASIYVTGQTYSQDFPVLQSAFQSTNGGQNDVFISKISQAAAPAFTVSPSLIQFSTRNVGTTSTPRSAVIRNMGTAALNIATESLTGDFAETDDCGSSIPPAGVCTFTVTFTPTAPGSRFGTILFGDNAAGSPHFINLVGQGSSPIAVFSPTSLTFASAPVNSTSAAQSITLSNTGNATLNISNIQITGDYAQTNDCPSALGLGSSCTFQVTFTPSTGGTRNGALTLTDDAPDSPQTVSLSGSGFVTTGTVSPSSLSFGNQNVGTSSSTQTVTVTNTGGNVMTVSGVVTSGDFVQTNTCSTIPVSGSCTISVHFAPTTSGSQSGTLTVNDNAQGNPHLVTLSGSGLAGTASLSASSMTFSALNVGAISAAQTLTVTNTGNGTLTMSSVQTTGDFSQTNNCTSIAPSSSCAVQITFTPTSAGTRAGSIILTNSAIGSPQTVTLSGSGIDFNMPASGGSKTVLAGSTASYQMDIAPVGGTFSNPIALTCAGVPAFATCTISPTSVTPGANASSVTVTITTKATVTATLGVPGARHPIFATLWMTNGLGVFGVLLFGNRKSKRSWYVLLGLVLLMTIILAGCGGGNSAASTPTKTTTTGTPAGTYNVIVIGTSGSAQHFSSLTLIVQ